MSVRGHLPDTDNTGGHRTGYRNPGDKVTTFKHVTERRGAYIIQYLLTGNM